LNGTVGVRAEEGGEQRELESVQTLGKNAGLRPFRSTRSKHFLAIGDAPDGFRALTLRDCEAVAADFLDYYRGQGFDVALPDRRLNLVVLADDRSFAAYLGKRELAMVPTREPGSAVHGLYQPATNRLVVLDHRPLGPQIAARPGHENLRALAHEVTHQLCFNTGFFDPLADTPACIIEGVAVFGEVRRLSGRTAPGQLNRMRLQDLANLQRRRLNWLPVARLLAEDGLVRDASAEFERLLAYAESWLLVHYLMADPARVAGFRKFLADTKARRDPARRLDDARAHLGDLDRLNQELRRYEIRLQKNQ
jgi:hypothetical protein